MLTLERARVVLGEFELAADIEVAAPGIVAVIGPSGAGKSTLLSLLAGFCALSQGRLLWNGRDISKDPPGDRPVSVVFQDNNLFPHLTAFQNVALGISHSLRLTEDDHSRVSAALDRVGLAGKEQRKPANLSGGEQSRVALARVLVQDKPVVLLDEPFAALGPALRAEMLDLVAETFQAGSRLVLFVTHDPDDARKVADRVIFVSDGKVHAPSPTDSVLSEPSEEMRRYMQS